MVQIRDNLEFEIILVLLKGKFHLREISRILKESHATILRKINLLTEMNILDYKKEGKNNVYFIKKNIVARHFIYQAEHYKLLKIIKKYPKLAIILGDISEKIREDIIILFGSYAKFSAKEDSDIDIYVESNKNELKNKLKQISSKISLKMGKFDSNSLLIKEIIKNHVILKGVEKIYDKTEFFD
ncbi:MAG: nucleotidyltransferase domain-containing protein [Nanoarchaeota archaeon]